MLTLWHAVKEAGFAAAEYTAEEQHVPVEPLPRPSLQQHYQEVRRAGTAPNDGGPNRALP
jgi:hypothetical protein